MEASDATKATGMLMPPMVSKMFLEGFPPRRFSGHPINRLAIISYIIARIKYFPTTHSSDKDTFGRNIYVCGFCAVGSPVWLRFFIPIPGIFWLSFVGQLLNHSTVPPVHMCCVCKVCTGVGKIAFVLPHPCQHTHSQRPREAWRCSCLTSLTPAADDCHCLSSTLQPRVLDCLVHTLAGLHMLPLSITNVVLVLQMWRSCKRTLGSLIASLSHQRPL